MVRTDRADKVHLRRAADAGDLSLVGFGDLNGESAHAAGGSVDQNPLPGPDLSIVAKTLQGRESRHGHRRRFFKRQIGWFQHQSILSDTNKLGESSEAPAAEDFVPRLKLPDVAADRFDLPRDIRSEDLVRRPEKANSHESDEKRVGPEMTPLKGIDGRRADSYQYLIVLGDGLLDLFELEDIRRAILRVNDGFHELLSFLPSLS